MNIKANGDLLAAPEVAWLSVPASGGDESLSAGACFAVRIVEGVPAVEVLEDLGRRHQVSLATMAYAWILRHPSLPVPITGSQRLEALQEAVAALSLPLPAEDWYRVLEACLGHPVA